MLLRNSTGEKVRIADYEPAFVDVMNRLHESQPELFSVGNCLENFSLKRSMRRGAVLAVGDKVSEHVVNLMNRWRKKERAQGTEPGLTMHQHYTQVQGSVQLCKAYSAAM